MYHDASFTIAAIVATSVTTLAAAAPQSALSEEQIVVISVATGALGGVLATLTSKEPFSIRELLSRMLASVLLAPATMYAVVWYMGDRPLTLFPVMSAAGVAGMAAWPLSQHMPRFVPALMKRILNFIKSEGGSK